VYFNKIYYICDMKKPNLKRMSKEEIEKNRIKAYTYATIKEEKMKTLLWLDDIRDPSVGDWLMSYAPEFAYGEGEVVWVKNFDDFVNHRGCGKRKSLKRDEQTPS
jgi:hypothetical protein